MMMSELNASIKNIIYFTWYQTFDKFTQSSKQFNLLPAIWIMEQVIRRLPLVREVWGSHSNLIISYFTRCQRFSTDATLKCGRWRNAAEMGGWALQ